MNRAVHVRVRSPESGTLSLEKDECPGLVVTPNRTARARVGLTNWAPTRTCPSFVGAVLRINLEMPATRIRCPRVSKGASTCSSPAPAEKVSVTRQLRQGPSGWESNTDRPLQSANWRGASLLSSCTDTPLAHRRLPPGIRERDGSAVLRAVAKRRWAGTSRRGRPRSYVGGFTACLCARTGVALRPAIRRSGTQREGPEGTLLVARGRRCSNDTPISSNRGRHHGMG